MSLQEMQNDRGMHYYNDANWAQSSSSNGYYAGSEAPPGYNFKESKKNKSKSRSSSSSSSWNFRNDPELKRKQRVASYKVFTVEGKMKASVRTSFRWIKNKYLEIRYGWF